MLARHKVWLLPLFQKIRELQAKPLEKRLVSLEIQEQLLYRIGRAEHQVRMIRKENKSIKRALAQPGASREVARKAKAKNQAGYEKIEGQQILISVLRSIGDSIAFIYGDRWDLKQMVQKEASGFLTGKRGVRLERKIFRKAFEIGATVVLNDLTHTLRHGDIAVFRPDLWPDGGSPCLLIEVKSGRGGDAARASRQMTAIKRMIDYLSTDKREAENGQWQRISVAQEPQYHFADATRLMCNLPQAGWLMEEVEPGLHYVLIDSAYKEMSYDTIFGKVFSRGKPLMICVNDMKNQTLGYYPFPLSIEDPEALFRFYNGAFVMFVIVYLEQVNERLAKYSLQVTSSGNDEYPWMVSPIGVDVPNNEDISYVGYHPIGRLAAEFLRLDWLLDNMVAGTWREGIAQYLNGGL